MSGPSSIEWTDATWNPVRGCSRVSEGCRNCYAERQAARFSGVKPKLDDDGTDLGEVTRGQFYGYAEQTKAGPRWTGRVQLVESALDWPLRKRKPLRIFVNSMSDLFHERLSNEEIAAVFGVMAACPQHTFQVLTKRPERMRKWFEWLADWAHQGGKSEACTGHANERLGLWGEPKQISAHGTPWPLSNVWLGVSVEDQATADERIPLLLQCPAAVRFVSYEPALGPVDFEQAGAIEWDAVGGATGGGYSDFVRTAHTFQRGLVDQIIVGGESGPGARPFDLAWARSVVEQCKAAGVACFVKQLGARPRGEPWIKESGKWVQLADHPAQRNEIVLRDRKGGDASEWPEDLRVREFPA